MSLFIPRAQVILLTIVSGYSYGAPAEDVCSFECAILVATGIGVTPWASVLKTIIAKHRSNTLKPLRRVYFIWLNRDASGFEWFASMVQPTRTTVEA